MTFGLWSNQFVGSHLLERRQTTLFEAPFGQPVFAPRKVNMESDGIDLWTMIFLYNRVVFQVACSSSRVYT